MSTLLLENARVLVTMDGNRREIEKGAILVRDHLIQAVGSSNEVRRGLDQDPDRCIDVGGCVLMPGLINCHHHLYQTLTRGLGTRETKSPDMLSLILFQPDYLRTLMDIGESDALARVDEIAEFLLD